MHCFCPHISIFAITLVCRISSFVLDSIRSAPCRRGVRHVAKRPVWENVAGRTTQRSRINSVQKRPRQAQTFNIQALRVRIKRTPPTCRDRPSLSSRTSRSAWFLPRLHLFLIYFFMQSCLWSLNGGGQLTERSRLTLSLASDWLPAAPHGR